MYHFTKKSKPYTFMSIYDICRISFWRLIGLQCGHTTYTYTPTILKSNGFIGCVQLNAISKS